MRILGVSGSLQSSSANSAVLRVARVRAPEGVDVVLFDALAEIPPFNPETEPVPVQIDAFRSLVRAADGVLFATPEYAHGLAGVLKNALDWLVGSGELYGKRVAVMSAAPSSERGQHARADLERTLRAQGAVVRDSRTIAAPTSTRGREIDDAHIVASVEASLAALVEDA